MGAKSKNEKQITKSDVKSDLNGDSCVSKEELVNDEKLKSKDVVWKNLTYIEKAKLALSIITVEPILACYVMPSVLAALATQNLYLEKACRVNLKYADHICDALTKRETANYTMEEEAVQKMVAWVAGWKTILQSFIPCGILIFLGAYSDRVGQRKVCMLLPIIGELLSSIGLIINTYFFYELPLEVAAVTEAIFPALTGGWFTLFMGIFSYIADVTTEEQRTLRIGIVNLFYSLGVPIGAGLSGILVRKIGLYGVFTFTSSLYIFSFLYGFYRIKEVKRPDVEKPKNLKEFLRMFFDTKYVKETLMVAFKKRENLSRMRVIMLVVVLCVIIGPIYGEMSVMYLFTRYRFNWNEVDYSIFSTYAMCTSLLGTLFSVGVFSHVLKYDDAVIGVISCMSKILSGFMYAFSTKTWHIYIAPLIELFNGTSFIAIRSMVSKLVNQDELGKVNSFFGLAEAMMPLVYAPMYTSLYTATLKTFPGAFFLLGGGLTVPAVVIFLWLYLENKTHSDLEIKKNNLSSDTSEKAGVDNKCFQNDETRASVKKLRIENMINASLTGADTKATANPTQIEIGFTESMVCTSKL